MILGRIASTVSSFQSHHLSGRKLFWTTFIYLSITDGESLAANIQHVGVNFPFLLPLTRFAHDRARLVSESKKGKSTLSANISSLFPSSSSEACKGVDHALTEFNSHSQILKVESCLFFCQGFISWNFHHRAEKTSYQLKTSRWVSSANINKSC